MEVVKKIEVTSVNVSSTSYTLFEGETVRLAYWVKPSDATDQSLKWSSSDPSIATVDPSGKSLFSIFTNEKKEYNKRKNRR